MDRYKVVIKFKDQRTLEIEADTSVNPKEELSKELDKKSSSILSVGGYFIKKDEILWIQVEGEELEKHIRE